MQAPSRTPTSNQPHLHPKLAVTVQRHLDTDSRRPVAAHTVAAFKALSGELAARPRPLVLDSFCGTGQSTALLAQRHPQHLVVGIDKSSHRLGKHPGASVDNYLLIQAECEGIWELLVRAGFKVDHHYLLYPNPWPKAKHLQRRIHGSAGLSWLLRLTGEIELRSNWQTYVEEFGVALYLAGCPGAVAQVAPGPALSPFERKYRDSAHALWAFKSAIPAISQPHLAGRTSPATP